MRTVIIFWTLVLWLALVDEIVSLTRDKRSSCDDCEDTCDECDNYCNEDRCCSTRSCTTCVNRCSKRCRTSSCRNSCVNQCSDEDNCCESDCSNKSCRSCSSQGCPKKTCNKNCRKNSDCSVENSDCTNKCTENEKIEKCEQNTGQVLLEVPEVNVNNSNTNVVNLTTHINVNNVIHNFHNISIPITVNTTNINNFNFTTINNNEDRHSHMVIDRTNTSSDKQILPIIIPPSNQPCCQVLHPKQCYTEKDGRKRCIQHRHKECSNICSSSVVTIHPSEQRQNCQYIQNYPYVYCGNYKTTDCGSCYSCNDNFNPSVCSRQSTCPNACRSSVLPNCFSTNTGMDCY